MLYIIYIIYIQGFVHYQLKINKNNNHNNNNNNDNTYCKTQRKHVNQSSMI